jgi:hypothetical protein
MRMGFVLDVFLVAMPGVIRTKLIAGGNPANPAAPVTEQ